MQSSTRANLEANYNYHVALAEYHKERTEYAGGSGDSVAGASAATSTAEGESAPTSRSGRSTRLVPRDPSVTLSRDQALFELHDDVAKQLRAALDAWQDPPTQDVIRGGSSVKRSTTSAMARSAAAPRTRH